MTILIIIILSGFFFIAAGEFFYLDLTGIGKRKAIKEFPVAAQELGFKLTKKRSSQNFGFFSGQYRKYEFDITPDYSAKIILKMQPIKGLEQISTASGNIEFMSQNSQFDKLFKTREATKEFAPVIQQATRFQKAAITFSQQWQRPSDYIGIDNNEIRITLKYGHGSYIPASVLKKIIPDMVELADIIQQDLGGK